MDLAEEAKARGDRESAALYRRTAEKYFEKHLEHEGRAMNWNRLERAAAFICGVLFIVFLIVLAIFFPNPEPFQYTVFRIVLALAAAGFAAFVPGFVEVKVGKWVRAGGALAVFCIVYFYSPAGLAT